MLRRTPIPAALLTVLLAAPAGAVIREWYEYYDDAKSQVATKRYAEALKSLQEAARLHPASGLNPRTYGMWDVKDGYFPYYQQGICYLRLGDFNSAARLFNIEADQGVIQKREDLYKDLLRLRNEAQREVQKEKENADRQRLARLAREEVDRLLKDSGELAKARKYEEALRKLAMAQAAAEALDPETKRAVRELQDRIRADQREQAGAETRARRVEDDLGQGRKLLDEGKPTEAIVAFDAVLSLDPANARALEGKRDAQERIRASKTKETLDSSFQQGKALFEAGQYEQALRPLTDAAADPGNKAARDLLDRARKVVEGMRQQREIRTDIDRLLADAESLLRERKYPEAQVKFESVVQLDPGNVRARQRLRFAETMTGEALFEKWLPNQKPIVTFFEPQGHEFEMEGPTLALMGVASDDRSVASVEFRAGDRLVARLVPPPSESGEPVRSFRFDPKLSLAPGPNEITVTATDGLGLSQVDRFKVTRRLRFYETRAFLPSALAAALALVGLTVGAQRARQRRAVRSRFNPYIAGAPVLDDDMFFGRDKLMARMMNVLHHNSLMITGERRIGKTTFLYHLKKALHTDEGTEYRFFPVFTDLQGVAESGFFHAVMADVAETLKLGPATQGLLRFRTAEDAYDGRDFSHDLQRVIEELKTRTPKKVKLALLIDEVDVLNEYSERINQRLRSIFMKTFSEHLVAIMSGVGIKRVWKSEGSPWYNFFDEIELSAFSREEAENLIRQPVVGVFRFAPEAVEGILAYSHMKPYVIQKFCIHAINRILEDGRTTVTALDVEAIRETVQFEGHAQEPARAPLSRQASA